MLKKQSWGRYPPARRQEVWQPAWRCDPLPDFSGKAMLPYGLGRSYGDVCLNDGGVLLDTRRLDKFIAFDRQQGILCCEAGVSLDQILTLIVPAGWFLPVTPGTRYITLGGAIANDVHGKNHHGDGSFGHHLSRFELLRSDGTRLTCSRRENPDWFRATIGGLGLTGLILWAEFRLQAIHNPLITSEVVKFANIEEFFELSGEFARTHVYSVSWLDCLSRGKSLGRGLFMCGNHAPHQSRLDYRMRAGGKLGVPLDFPGFFLNHYSIKAFNFLYYHKQLRRIWRGLSHYQPFFYPLDSVEDWNRIYGRQGFFQYQCVLPEDSPRAARKLLETVAASGQGSFLGVMKVFGNHPPAGLLSFPREGFTLALDFPNRGQSTLDLFQRLDRIVLEYGGLLYPGKDARMSAAMFKQGYPQWETFRSFLDPRFSSGFWRRVSRGR